MVRTERMKEREREVDRAAYSELLGQSKVQLRRCGKKKAERKKKTSESAFPGRNAHARNRRMEEGGRGGKEKGSSVEQ